MHKILIYTGVLASRFFYCLYILTLLKIYLNKNMFLELKMKNQNGKITLPVELQKQMIRFFLKTSIPRKKRAKSRGDACEFSYENLTAERQKNQLLSNKTDRGND